MGLLDTDVPSEIPYEPLPDFDAEDFDTPELAGAETYELEAHSNLDKFFSRIYKFWHGKGLYNIIIREITNLIALLFTICFSAFLLLYVDWDAINNKCIQNGTCALSEVIIVAHPFSGHSYSWILWRMLYLMFFTTYWLYSLMVFMVDLPGLLDVKRFCKHRLGLSEQHIQWLSWQEVINRVILVQRKIRLCVARDLTELDIVNRIMRKENYLMGMLNKGVLALNLPIPGFRRRFLLTKTLEWNIYWCVMDAMFDDSFQVKEKFKSDPEALRKRFRHMAIANLLLAPFVFMFLIIYFLMKNTEKFYTTPSTIATRGWSPLAKWQIREFNEMIHASEERLAASFAPSVRYIDQFPNYKLMHIGKLFSFIVGSFAFLVLLSALLEDSLLEGGQFLGRNLVWWGAVLTVTLRVCRSFVQEQRVFDPEGALQAVTEHTHYVPRHWRGRAHTREVQQEFQKLFPYKGQIFIEELASVVLTPFVLFYSLPRSADAILAFVRDFTVRLNGVGDVCSFATFDLRQHGNCKYASPCQASKNFRSRQGKMEKSCMSFVASYTTWKPHHDVKEMLQNLVPYAYLRESTAPSEFFRGRELACRVPTKTTKAPHRDTTHERVPRPVKPVEEEGARCRKPEVMLQSQRDIEMSALHLSNQGDSKDTGVLSSHQASLSSRSQPELQGMQDSSTTMGSSLVSCKEQPCQDDASSNPPEVSVDREWTPALAHYNCAAGNRHAPMQDKVREAHRVLYSFYNDHDETVQHSMANISAQFQRGTWMDWVRPPESEMPS